jgi:hypothetical protein
MIIYRDTKCVFHVNAIKYWLVVILVVILKSIILRKPNHIFLGCSKKEGWIGRDYDSNWKVEKSLQTIVREAVGNIDHGRPCSKKDGNIKVNITEIGSGQGSLAGSVRHNISGFCLVHNVTDGFEWGSELFYADIFTYTHTDTHKNKYTQTHADTHTQTHADTHTDTQTQIHTQTHTQRNECNILEFQRSSLKQHITASRGNWSTTNSDLVAKYLNAFSRFVKSIDFNKMQ